VTTTMVSKLGSLDKAVITGANLIASGRVPKIGMTLMIVLLI